ncbi:MAG: dephospho-CoA kinase [Bacteriovoracaceae bacterium]|nr:dephospho-CoA kinase [Bacteriovoracaceae bacterium]
MAKQIKLNSKLIRLKASSRLYQLEIPIVAVTGGIASGKSYVSSIMADMGLTTICADSLIKNIYTKRSTILFIANNFPNAMKNGIIDFKVLRQIIFNNEESKNLLETFLHPQLTDCFTQALKKLPKNLSVVVYDVPLLFEKGMQVHVDQSICVYCEYSAQLERLQKRDKITQQLASKILGQQMDINTKRQLADFVIDNTSSLSNLKRNALATIKEMFDL